MIRFYLFRKYFIVLYCLCFICFCCYNIFEFKPRANAPATTTKPLDHFPKHDESLVHIARWSKERSLFSTNDSPAGFHLNAENCFIPNFVESIVLSNRSTGPGPALPSKFNPIRKPRKSYDPSIFSSVTSNGVLNLKMGKNTSSQIHCCFRKLNRLEANYYHRITNLSTSRKCTPLKTNKTISIQAENLVLVECTRKKSNRKPEIVYQNVHFNVPVKTSLVKFWKFFENVSKTAKPPNVFIIGVDRLTQASLQKYLPKSFRILTSPNNSFTNFKGFTSQGDQRPLESLIPLLTGKSYSYWSKNCNAENIPEDKPKNIKDCDLGVLWKSFESLKYETAFAEEILLKSLMKQENDFLYDRPEGGFDIPLFQNSKFNTYQLAKLFSNQTVHPVQEIFKYGTHFTTRSIPTFAFLWLKSYMQDTQAFDKLLSKALLKMMTENSFVILVSGRGSGTMQSEVETIEVKLNQYLPALFIRIPPKIHQLESRFQTLLEMNAGRLVTPFDVHETLKSLITLGIDSFVKSGNENITEKMGDLQTTELNWDKAYGVSLMTQEVSPRRTCASGRIPSDFCPCSGDSRLLPSKSSLIASIVSSYGLELANFELSQDSEYKSLCSNWEFEKQLSAKAIQTSKDHELVELTFEANPGSNAFQILCKFQALSKAFSCDTASFMRLSNANPLEGYCMDNGQRSFNSTLCYCNE